MDKQYYRNKLFDIRMKIALLSPKEKGTGDHPYYQELENAKKEYALYLMRARKLEEEKNDKHKRK